MESTCVWWKRPIVHALLLAGLFFGAIAPTLTWLDFSGGMENFNVITAMEMQRDGHWLLPTLNGAPRLQKPPLTQWVTAWGIMGSDSLAWGARWPSLLMACLMLVAVYDLGRTLDDWRLGLVSALICGSTLFFLRYARRASYDMQLALWVTVANLFFARLLFRRQMWIGCLGAAVGLGLALMTKGPPALAQTLLPLALFGVWDRMRSPRSAGPRRGRVFPILCGLALLLLIVLPWPIYVTHAMGDQWRMWFNEINLTDEKKEGLKNSPLVVLVFLPLCLPWMVWFFAGLHGMVVHRREPIVRGLMLMLILLVAPTIIISLVPPIRDRYLLPMLAPAAIFMGYGVVEHLKKQRQWNRGDRILIRLHWIGLAIVGIGVSLMMGLGAGGFRTPEGQVLYSPIWTVVLAGVAAVMVVGSVWAYRRWAMALVGGTVVAMLFTQGVFFHGLGRSADEQSVCKVPASKILAAFPDAIAYSAGVKAPPREMAIYLNRVVRPLENLKALQPGEHPQVVFVLKGAMAVPSGYVPMSSFAEGKKIWQVWVLPGKEKR